MGIESKRLHAMFSTTVFVAPGMNGLRTRSRMESPQNACDAQTPQSAAGDVARRLAERVHRRRRDVLEPMLWSSGFEFIRDSPVEVAAPQTVTGGRCTTCARACTRDSRAATGRSVSRSGRDSQPRPRCGLAWWARRRVDDGIRSAATHADDFDCDSCSQRSTTQPLCQPSHV